MGPLLIFFAALAYIATTVRENLSKAFKNEVPSKYEAVWCKLHTSNPGTEGKTAAATEATRKKITFTGTSLLKNTGVIKWTAVSTSETITFVSFWTLETGGTFLGYSLEVPKVVLTAGDNLEIPSEGLEWPIA